ncbi:uncharacterized protein LOC126972043 [Leptidea sinapis]|uniref:uncharacterized protein LOC126972043 n=1 Tax=Leptidea sinapis TaxID=189913 RepID=UPI0021C2556B|nr:uncharacterized protein LOC126972043 [Leptidea sinapis]
MKALYIEKCKDMVKKRRQEMSSSYADLQNVTLTAAEKDQNSLPCYFEEKTPKTTIEMELDDNDAPPNISQCESEAMTEENQYKEKDQASNVLPENQCEESNALPYIVEGTSEVTMQPEIQNLGHRIIDFNHFTSELVKISQHKSLFKCGLSTMKLISEHRIGLQSEYTYVCMMCNYKNKIKSSLDDVNKDAVAGIMAAGCGHAQLKQFSAAVGLPIMSEYTYNKTQNDICRDWEDTAWDEMKLAGEREREEAIKEGKVTKDGIPMIDVIVDGCWSKQPKTKENSDDTVADTDKTADVDNFAFVDEDVADADDVSVVDSSEYIMAFSEY